MKNAASSNCKLPWVLITSGALWTGMLKCNLKCIYLQYWEYMKPTNCSEFCFETVGTEAVLCPTLLLDSIMISLPNANSRTLHNQNPTSHKLALTTSPRHCLLKSPSLNGNLNSPPTTWEWNPDTDR